MRSLESVVRLFYAQESDTSQSCHNVYALSGHKEISKSGKK